MRRLLLISNSTLHGSGYLEHCKDAIKEFLSEYGIIRIFVTKFWYTFSFSFDFECFTLYRSVFFTFRKNQENACKFALHNTVFAT